MHEVLSALDVLSEVKAQLPAASQLTKEGDLRVGFVLYDAFAVRGDFDDYGRGNWGFGVEVGGGATVSSVFGERLTLCGSREDVRRALAALDRYARLRLGTEYLDAYAAAQRS